jgi:hypothetical protein
LIVAQAYMVWKIDDADTAEFVETGRIEGALEPILPYDPAVMQTIATGQWSVGNGKQG